MDVTVDKHSAVVDTNRDTSEPDDTLASPLAVAAAVAAIVLEDDTDASPLVVAATPSVASPEA